MGQAIVDGAIATTYLALDERAAQWIVAVRPAKSLSDEPPVCTGFAISPTTIASSPHCKEGTALRATVLDGESERELALVDVRVHPTLEVLIASVDPRENFSFEHYAPLWNEAVDGALIGQRAGAAGYGADEVGVAGNLRFIIEEVVAVADEHVVVSANGAGGPCNGDSGAPLLARRAAGALAVLGVLRGGSESCRGADVFVRGDALLRWASREVPLAPGARIAADCDAIGAEGRCARDGVLQCSAATASAQACAAHEVCGWSAAVQGYRCVPVEQAACSSDRFGRCDGDQVVRCAGGVPISVDCSRCGLSCVYGATGTAQCGERAPLPHWVREL